MKPYSRSNDGLDDLRRDPAVNRAETGRGWQERPSWDGPGSMSPTPDGPELAALRGLGGSMRRGRFMDALPEEEQQAIRIVISPGGGVSVEGGAEGGDPDMDGDMEGMEGGPEAAQELATGGLGASAISAEDDPVIDEENPIRRR